MQWCQLEIHGVRLQMDHGRCKFLAITATVRSPNSTLSHNLVPTIVQQPFADEISTNEIS